MMARSHVVLGLAAWAVAAPALHLPVLQPIHLGLVVIGSLLPDIDHPKSWAGRHTRPISTALAAIVGHRGITHSAIALIAIVALLFHGGYHRGSVTAVAVGYLSHLGADMLTPQGLRLAWPLPGTWALALCRTGSSMESAIVAIAAGGAVWWLLRGHMAWMTI